MFRRYIAYLVCCCVLLQAVAGRPAFAAGSIPGAVTSESELRQQYPDANFIHVSPDEYPRLAERLSAGGYRQSAVMPLQLAADTRYIAGAAADRSGTAAQRDCADTDDQADDDSIQLAVDITDDFVRSGGDSSSDSAAVFFIVVGTIVVVVWTLYIFRYLYDISLGRAYCNNWRELGVVSSRIESDSDQYARFNGLSYATGFRSGMTDIGIGFEIGESSIRLSDLGTLELEGTYWLLGPVVRWRLFGPGNAGLLRMHFDAGSTEHDEIGLLARAGIGLVLGIGESMQLGLSWSVLNIDIDEERGIIRERSQYRYLYGLRFGFRF